MKIIRAVRIGFRDSYRIFHLGERERKHEILGLLREKKYHFTFINFLTFTNSKTIGINFSNLIIVLLIVVVFYYF